MKYIFVNTMIGMYRGGGENFDLNLSRELSKMGHSVEIYYLCPLFKKQKFELPDYVIPRPVKAPWLYHLTQHLHLIPIVKNIRGLRGLPRIIGQFIFEIHTFFLLKARKKEDFILHLCSLWFLGVLSTKILNKKTYVRFPGPPSFSLHYWAIRNVYGVIANGDAYNQITHNSNRLDILRLEVGINENIFIKKVGRKDAQRVLSLPKDKKFLLFVGRLVSIKNISMLIRVMNNISQGRNDIDLIIVGDGSEKKDLISQVESFNLKERIHFVGEKNSTDLRNYYTAAEIFVLSSHYDNYPNVIIEAMSMTLPVIATNVGGVSLQVEHNYSGCLVTPDDDKEMSKCVLSLIDDKDKMLEMGSNGKHKVLKIHNWKETAELFVQVSSINN